MKRRNAKLAAYILIGAVALSSASLEADATGVSSLLPAAGLALTMEEGEEVASAKSTSEDKTQKKENKKEEDKTFKKEIGAAAVTEKDSAKDAKNTEVSVKNALTAEKEEEKEKEPLIIEKDTKKEESKSSVKNTESSDESKETESEEELTKEEKEFSKLVIAKVNDYVNIRSMPSEEGEILGKLYDKSVGDFILEKDGWYKITSGSVTGYVKAEYCVTGKEAVELAKKVGTRVATVTTTTLKVRESEGLNAPVLGLVPIEEELSVVEELDGWVKVDIEEGYGYVSSDYVSLRTDFVKAESREEEEARLKKEEDAKKAAKEAAKKAEEKVAKERAEKSASQSSSSSSEQTAASVPASSGSGIGSEVVNYAMQFVGNPYVYGGSSLTNGTDCSGFVMSVYKNFGVSLPHSSSADRNQGYDVGGLENAQPGDIVCYSGHVGIYAGNGQIVHASTSKTGIIVSNANYRNVLAVRRIF
ncbi:MAG: C40 family peptidase [Lachnospiraceae bacterium]|nr:C40 family peptidase [Lachnospiraceae bacterium]